MILTTPKTWEEIHAAIISWKIHSVVVVSCGSCAAGCGTGGTEGLEKIVASLTSEDVEILGSIVIQVPCDARLVKRDLKYLTSEIELADGIIVASCGISGQIIAQFTQKPIIVTTDTVMISETKRLGEYENRCIACGNCLLNETGGICPYTACAKSLLNGPCGGMRDGKCEVGNYTEDCGWVLIYNRLKELDRLDSFYEVHLPNDWRNYHRRTVDIKQLRESYYTCGGKPDE